MRPKAVFITAWWETIRDIVGRRGKRYGNESAGTEALLSIDCGRYVSWAHSSWRRNACLGKSPSEIMVHCASKAILNCATPLGQRLVPQGGSTFPCVAVAAAAINHSAMAPTLEKDSSLRSKRGCYLHRRLLPRWLYDIRLPLMSINATSSRREHHGCAMSIET